MTATLIQIERPGSVDGIPGRWALHARCRDLPVDMFFGDDPRDEDRALNVCALCPVRAACRRYAVARPQLTGVWGGVTETTRHRLHAERAFTVAS